MSITVFECHSLGDRTPLGACNTLVGAAAFIAAYASMAGWQIGFWGIDPDHEGCADAILRKGTETRVFCCEPSGL